MLDNIAFKILLASDLVTLKRKGYFAGTVSDVAGGFIHMSTAAQIEHTLKKHFAGVDGLCVVAIDLELLGNKLRWEHSSSGQLYPHLYGSLPLDAVVADGPLKRNGDGSVRLPVGAQTVNQIEAS